VGGSRHLATAARSASSDAGDKKKKGGKAGTRSKILDSLNVRQNDRRELEPLVSDRVPYKLKKPFSQIYQLRRLLNPTSASNVIQTRKQYRHREVTEPLTGRRSVDSKKAAGDLLGGTYDSQPLSIIESNSTFGANEQRSISKVAQLFTIQANSRKVLQFIFGKLSNRAMGRKIKELVKRPDVVASIHPQVAYFMTQLNVLLVMSRISPSIMVSNNIIRSGHVSVENDIVRDPFYRVQIGEMVRVSAAYQYVYRKKYGDGHFRRWGLMGSILNSVELNNPTIPWSALESVKFSWAGFSNRPTAPIKSTHVKMEADDMAAAKPPASSSPQQQ